MKKETHMQIFFKYSGFLLTIFFLTSLIRASTNQVLPGQSTDVSTISVSTQDQQKPIAANVKAQKANLRDRSFKSGSVVRTVKVQEMTVATVWSPKFFWEEIQGWARGMNLSIAQGLPRAKSVARLLGAQLLPANYRQGQLPQGEDDD